MARRNDAAATANETTVDTKKKPAILISCAVCIGSGSDKFKRVNGITKALITQADSINPDAVLVAYSNTGYGGCTYKQIDRKYRSHRQIEDSAIEIIATIGAV